MAFARRPLTKSCKNPDPPDLPQDLQLGDVVCDSSAKRGILRFLGITKFAKGIWAGIELEVEEGINDGSVNGHRYFQCKQNFGIFIREHCVKKSITLKEEKDDDGEKRGILLKEKDEEMERMAEEMERMKKDLKEKERELGMKENEIKGLENDLKAKERELGIKDDEIERLRSNMGRDEAGVGEGEMWRWSGAAGEGEMRCASRTSSDEEPLSLTESWSDQETDSPEFPLPTGIPEAVAEEAEEPGAAAALPAAPADLDEENDNFGEEEWEAGVRSLSAEDLSEADYRRLSSNRNDNITQLRRAKVIFHNVKGISFQKKSKVQKIKEWQTILWTKIHFPTLNQTEVCHSVAKKMVGTKPRTIVQEWQRRVVSEIGGGKFSVKTRVIAQLFINANVEK